MSRQRRLGLALGGGGARGLAHVGFLQVLSQAGIEVAAVSGTSIGAIVGAGYALYRDSRILQEVFEKFLKSDLFKEARFDFLTEIEAKQTDEAGLAVWLGGRMKRIIFQGMMLRRSGLLSDESYKRIINFFIPEVSFGQTKIPFACAALNLVDGRTRIFRQGSLPLAVQASAALPGLTEPVGCEGALYSDGGGVMVMPVEPLLEMGAEVVVAVDVDRPLEIKESYGNVVEVLIRWAEAASTRLKEKDLALTDLLVHPRVDDYRWADFNQGLEIIELGRRAARERLEEIKSLVRPRWWRLGRSGAFNGEKVKKTAPSPLEAGGTQGRP